MRKTGLDFTPEGAPSLSRRSLARQGGEFDSDRKYPGSEVKVPTLPQRTRQGWGTRFSFAKGWESTTVSVMPFPQHRDTKFLDNADRFTIHFAEIGKSIDAGTADPQPGKGNETRALPGLG